MHDVMFFTQVVSLAGSTKALYKTLESEQKEIKRWVDEMEGEIMCVEQGDGRLGGMLCMSGT